MGIPGVVGVLPGQEIVKLVLAPTPRPGLESALVPAHREVAHIACASAQVTCH